MRVEDIGRGVKGVGCGVEGGGWRVAGIDAYGGESEERDFLLGVLRRDPPGFRVWV